MANVTAGGTNSEADFYSNGYLEKADVATNTTITAAASSGIVQTFTANSTLTLPAASTGLIFKVRIGKAGLTVKIKPASTEQFTGYNLTPGASYILTFTNAVPGSYIELSGTSGIWYITALNLGGQGNSGVLTLASS